MGGMAMDGYYSKTEPRFCCCTAEKFSFFFELIAPRFSGEFRNCGAIHRICSLLRKMGVTHFVEEELEKTGEIQEEIEDVSRRCDAPLRSASFERFSFFYAPNDVPKDRLDLKQREDKLFLGYMVIARLELPDGAVRSYILEAVIAPPGKCSEKPSPDSNGRPKRSPVLNYVLNYYLHAHKVFPSVIGTRSENYPFEVDGAFFCQQNNLTHVCAHACLRMALNTTWHTVGIKISNRQINETLGIDHTAGRTVKGGLRVEQIELVLKNFGLFPYAQDFLTHAEVDYAEYLYPFVESGNPVILSFHPTYDSGHVVTIIGHTMNSDRWDCEAHLAYDPGSRPFELFHASSTWVDHFLINDDNFGMYTALPVGYLRNPIRPRYDPTRRARWVVSVFPSASAVLPYVAELYAVEKSVVSLRKLEGGKDSAGRPLLETIPRNRWLSRLIAQSKEPTKRLVARTVLTEKGEYVAFLRRISDLKDSEGSQLRPEDISDVESLLPVKFWVTEMTLPDLYTANKHKLGDMIHNETTSTPSTDPPGILYNTPEYVWGWLPCVEIPKVDDLRSWPLRGHVPLLRSSHVLRGAEEW
jgi:hypothetical protein